jgi:hypothetical protein
VKELIGVDQEVGGDGAKVKAGVGVEGDQLKVELAATYPLAKVVDPLMKVVDGLVDKLEQFIPGDQKALATTLKAEAREELVKLLSE